MDYVNPDKLMRAQAWAKEHAKAGDEKAIHDRYVALGGLVRGEEEINPVAFADMTLPKLKAKAKEMDIDLGDATTKDAIVEILTAAVTPEEAE